MPQASTLLLFAAATIALLVVPGPAVVYIVTRSMAQGRTAGLVSVLGIHVGSVVHVLAAALGITALLAASATAFTVVRYLGAAYLIWLGIQCFRRRSEVEETAEPPSVSSGRVFSQGVVVNVLNPKTAIFFLAFLPQFVDRTRGSVTLQLVLLGLCFIVLGILSDGTYAVLAGTLTGRLRRTARARRRLDLASGVIYLGLGVAAVLIGTGPPKN